MVEVVGFGSYKDLPTAKKVWGKELWIVNTPQYCGKMMELKQGMRCSLHYHQVKDETFFVHEGAILFELEGEVRELHPGDWVRIKPGMKHRFAGITDSVFYEFSTHHDDADTYRLEDSGPMPKR